MGIGKNLKELLNEKRMTIKELSELSGVSLNTLYSITKRDPNDANIETIKKLASALDVPYTVIFEQSKNGILVFDSGEDFEKHRDYILSSGKEKELLISFNKLNLKGKDKAIEQVEMLTKIDEYKK